MRPGSPVPFSNRRKPIAGLVFSPLTRLLNPFHNNISYCFIHRFHPEPVAHAKNKTRSRGADLGRHQTLIRVSPGESLGRDVSTCPTPSKSGTHMNSPFMRSTRNVRSMTNSDRSPLIVPSPQSSVHCVVRLGRRNSSRDFVSQGTETGYEYRSRARSWHLKLRSVAWNSRREGELRRQSALFRSIGFERIA